jgi:hypothetical protein
MAWVAIALVLAGILGILSAVLIRFLAASHPEAYERLGSPTFVPKDLRTTNWATFRFIWSSEFRRLESPQITRICWLIRLYTVLLLLWFVWPFVG